MNTTIVQVPVDKLIPAEYNPRKWDAKAAKQLRQSIEQFGFPDPIIVNSHPKRKNIIIGGHFRATVAKEMGLKTVPVVYVRIAELEREKELNLRLNKNTGEWDLNILAEFDKSLLKMVGFNSKDVDKIFADESSEDDFDPDMALAAIAMPTTKLGDLYQLGDHRLLCGDATKALDMQKLTAGQAIDMVFCDPPYNVDYQGGMGTHRQNKRQAIENDNMDPAEFREFLSRSIKNMMQYVNGPFYICMSSKELSSLKEVFEEAGGHWQSFIVWVKNTFTLSRSDWQNQYEPILYGWNGNNKDHYFAGYRDEGNTWDDLEKLKPIFNGSHTLIKLGNMHLQLDGKVTGYYVDKDNQTDIWREKKPSRNTEHPTMKPVPLVAKAIKASSARGGSVLDPFGGSGSTLIAAEQTQRKCYTMELDEKYCDVIVSRWEKLTKLKAVKL